VTYTHVAAALIALVLGFGGGWKVQAWRHDSAELEAQDQARETEKFRRQAANAGAKGHEVDKAAIRTQFLTITERVNVEVEKPVYRNVCLPADGLRELNEAIRATGDPGQPSNALPTTSGSR